IARPLVVSEPVDLPADRLARVIGAMREPALLEGGPGLGPGGRWSILTAEPRLVVSADAESWVERREGREVRIDGADPLRELDRILREFRLADSEDEPEPGGSP